MARFGVFVNLPPDVEADDRLMILARKVGLKPRDIYRVHGEGKYNVYSPLADQLRDNSGGVKLLVTTCWPTTDATKNAVNPHLYGIVFAGLSDSRYKRTYDPNVTGVRSFLPESLCPNWSYLLTQLQGSIKNIAVIYDKDTAHAGVAEQWSAIQTGTTGVTYAEIDARWPLSQIDAAINAFVTKNGDPKNSGLVVTSSTLTAMARMEIPRMAAGYGVAAIYPNSLFTHAGGLMSYGPDLSDVYDKAANDYLTPILKAIDAGTYDPTKTQATWKIYTFDSTGEFELLINRKALRAIGLAVKESPAKFTVKVPWASGTATQIPPTIMSS